MGDKGKKDREKITRQKLKKKNDKTENARKKQEKDAPYPPIRPPEPGKIDLFSINNDDNVHLGKLRAIRKRI